MKTKQSLTNKPGYFGPVIALAMKDLRHLIRDRGAAFFTLVFPLLIALFFGYIFGGGGERSGLNISIVDEDQTPASRNFVDDLRGDTSLVVYNAVQRQDAMERVRKGKSVAAVIVPSGFGQGAKSIFSGGGFTLEGYVDPSKHAEAGLLTGKLHEAAFGQLADIIGDNAALSETLQNARSNVLSSKDVTFANKALFATMFEAINRVVDSGGITENTNSSKIDNNITQPNAGESGGGADSAKQPAGWQPVTITLTELTSARMMPRSGYEVSFTQGIIWGLMGCVTSFGASLAAERSRGTLTRLSLAPITRGQVLAGKAFACFVASVGVQCALLLFGMLVFSIRIGSYPMLMLAILASSAGFTGVMMFMAGLSRTEGGGAGMGRALVLVLAMIGGGTVPLFVLPQFMQTVSKISPFSWASIAIEGALWRGYNLADMLLPAIILLSFGLVGFLIGRACLRVGD